MDIEYLLRDTIEPLRPKLHICDNMEEAQKAADELDNEFKAKLGQWPSRWVDNSSQSDDWSVH